MTTPFIRLSYYIFVRSEDIRHTVTVSVIIRVQEEE